MANADLIELIAFLGNPGPEYAQNRHNAGWLFAGILPFAGLLTWRNKYKGRYAVLDGARLVPYALTVDSSLPNRLHFLMPGTYMNLSGESVLAAASFFKIPPERILVVHDELELPLGTVSFKFSGGLGGHNGLRSMKSCFGTADFWRLRFGIGRPDDRAPGQGGPPGSGKGIVDWVLSDFTTTEASILEQVFPSAAAALIHALLEGPLILLPEWNKKQLI
jgi:PTH1 family peptidyl-tRNA hydrolase